jgi:glycosyltransferase involved in cell wall biosynthesis
VASAPGGANAFSLRRWIKRHVWAPQVDPLAETAVQRGIDLSPAVVHCHDLPTLPLGSRIADGAGARLIYDSHELEMHRNAVYAPAVYRWRRWTEKRHIRQTDAVITVSESIADHLRDDYAIPRPEVVLNAPDFDEAVTPTRDLRRDLALPAGTPIAVYVGSVTVNRGLDVMVRSLAYDPRLHFATVGPRRPQTEAELRAIAEELGVRDRLHFVDPLPPAEVVGYIRTATVSVLPIQNVCLSYYYCMPNKLLESAFAGVPVAVADLIEMRRFVETYRCGEIMDETDPVSVAEVLGRIAADREAYRMSPEHREAVAAWYGWPKQAEDLRNLYDRIAPAPVVETIEPDRREADG